jgi:membrane protein YdbS with pleckstrin-like domain
VLVRSGALVRKTSIIPEASIQHLQLTWSALQKALRLATVRVHIPGTQRRISDLEDEEAGRWFRLLAEARRPNKAA